MTEEAHVSTPAGNAPAMNGDRDEDLYDVVIVGFGPSGVVAANYAGMLGLKTLVLERDIDVFPRQRAIALDDEVMRIFQNLGLVDQIRQHMHEGLTMTFVTHKGKEFLRLEPSISDNGYWQQNFFHQPWLEGFLRAGVERFAELVEVRAGVEALRVDDRGEHVVVETRNIDTGQALEIRGRYVLGCDGGSSAIRKSLGFDLGGTSYPQQWMDVQGELIERVPGTPHFKFICDTERPGVDCPCPGGMHRYEWRIPKDEDVEESQKPENLWPILEGFSAMAYNGPDAGIDSSYLDIKRTWEYTFHVRNCERWRIGNVFLLGDAAHIMPPFAGQGMSAGMRDAANLVWKLALVLSGQADDALLDTYQGERQRHVGEMTKFSQALGAIVMTSSKPLAAMRDGFFLGMRKIPGLRQYCMSLKGRPAPKIREGFIGSNRSRKAATGGLIPNYDVGTPNGRMLLDDALGYGVRIIGMDCDPREKLDPTVIARWEALGAECVRVRSGTLIVDEGEVGDPVGRLWNWFHDHGQASVAIVRPDRVVYALDSDGVDLSPPFVAHRPARAALVA